MVTETPELSAVESSRVAAGSSGAAAGSASSRGAAAIDTYRPVPVVMANDRKQ